MANIFSHIKPNSGTPYVSTLPTDRPLMGKDIAQWRQTMNLSTAEICWLLSLPSTKWGLMIKENQDQPIHHEMELLVRTWDAHKHLIPLPQKVSISMLQDSLGVTPSDIGLLLGREEISGTRWVKNENGDVHVGQAQTPLSQRLTLAVYQLSESNQRNQYFQTLMMVGALRGIPDVLKQRTWKTPEERRISKIKRLVNSSAKVLSTNTTMSTAEKAKYLRIQSCASSWVRNFELLTSLKKKIKATSNELSRLNKLLNKKPADKAKKVEEAHQKVSSEMDTLNSELTTVNNELRDAETHLVAILGPELDGKLLNSGKGITLGKRIQKLLQNPQDNIVAKYTADLAKEWLQLDSNVEETRLLLSSGTQSQIMDNREKIDTMNARKTAIQHTLESVLGPKLNGQITKSSMSDKLSRQIHHLAKRQDDFAFTSNPIHNHEITQFIKDQAAKWLDLSAKSNSLQPLLVVLNDEAAVRKYGVLPETKAETQSEAIQLGDAMSTIESKLQSLLGNQLDSAKFKSPELLSQIRQINSWKANASKPTDVLKESHKKVQEFILKQTTTWLNTLSTVESIAPLNIVSESNPNLERIELESKLRTKLSVIYHILARLENETTKQGNELRMLKKIERIRQNAVNFLTMSSGEPATPEIHLNEQVLAQCDKWLELQSQIDDLKPLSIIEEAMAELEPETATDDNSFIKSEFSSLFSDMLITEGNLKALLGNNLDGKHEKDEESSKLHRKISRLISRAAKEIEIANKLNDDAATAVWTQAKLQAERWIASFAELGVNQRYQVLIQNSNKPDNEKLLEMESLQEQEHLLASQTDSALRILSALLQDKFDSSYSEIEKAFNKVKRKVQSLLTESVADEISNSASAWVTLNETLAIVESKLAILDSKKSLGLEFDTDEFQSLENDEADLIAKLEQHEIFLGNSANIDFQVDAVPSKVINKAQATLATLQKYTHLNDKQVQFIGLELIEESQKASQEISRLVEDLRAKKVHLAAYVSTSLLLSKRASNYKKLNYETSLIAETTLAIDALQSDLSAHIKKADKIIKSVDSKL
ncbi:hypothetical protein OCF84_20880 (plasmid) [Shewanella xiamenensis]|uniref:Uncharacterized protein n=1 Tax=Shewanella xiamenensis TaxID=332186 RepID=A0ABT6UID3_9GAMM|nr:hypothetical protein [Shewanella xiamenensis]MDI5833276.1 hypothetical protein [Shewanella xiamenensis]WHF57974.1 hypothetical protein OCF84_20880 [Shewanella xiamenensis]